MSSSMSSSALPPLPRPLSDADVVTRLRAAGCVFAEDEARLLSPPPAPPAELAVLVDRRAAGEPLEHVLGWAEFCGHHYAVDPGVFVPRRRTEFLMWQAAARPSLAGRAARRAAGGRGRPVLRLGRAGRGAGRGAGPGRAARRRHRPGRGARAPAATWPPRTAGSTRATCTSRCPRRCAAGSTSCWPTCPTCPPATSGCCPPRPGCTRRGWRSTAARTGWTCCGGWRPRPRPGWRPAVTCSSETSVRQAELAAEIVAGHGLAAQTVVSSEWNSAVVVGSPEKERRR